MSSIYLVRHGQAGLRHDYDRLSDLGRKQARNLGEWLVAQDVRFQAICSGALERQRQTAEEVRQVYLTAGLPAPEISTDVAWNEFDLDQVYRELAPILSESDPKFRADYDEMRRLARDDNSTIHRTWSSSDMAVVRAWTSEKYAVHKESWSEFTARVLAGLSRLSAYGAGESVAVFSSATPIAVGIGHALGVANGSVMRLAGVIYNAGLSTLHQREGDVRLFSFNNSAHLPAPMRTFR